MTVEPNVPNVIPGRIQFSIDIRHQEETVLSAFHQKWYLSLKESVTKKASGPSLTNI